MAKDRGVSKVVREAQQRQARGERPAVQLPLIADDREDRAPAAANDDGPRGPGRPPGAVNKRTADMRDFILSRYRSPLEVLAQTYSRPVAELAAELDCSLEDAFKAQLFAAKELAPYVHGKMPVEVDLKGRGIVPLVLNVSQEMADAMPHAVEDGGFVLDLTPVEGDPENDDKSEG